MGIQEPSRNAGTRAATALCRAEADGGRRRLVPLVKPSEGGSGVGRRAFSLPGSWISGRPDSSYDPVALNAAGLAAAGSP